MKRNFGILTMEFEIMNRKRYCCIRYETNITKRKLILQRNFISQYNHSPRRSKLNLNVTITSWKFQNIFTLRLKNFSLLFQLQRLSRASRQFLGSSWFARFFRHAATFTVPCYNVTRNYHFAREWIFPEGVAFFSKNVYRMLARKKISDTSVSLTPRVLLHVYIYS